ncbi:MAG: hypothetical protein HY042_00815 [Spirochaetia bacterium]|nr:hypothetical protein [Spirochaetia bacterium]
MRSKDALFSAGMEVLIEMRSQRIDRALQDRETVDTLFTGDSLVHILELYAEGNGAHEFNNAVYTGIAGDRSDSFLYRLGDHVLRLRPSTVVVSIGGNDLGMDCPQQAIQLNKQKILARLRAGGVRRPETFSWRT